MDVGLKLLAVLGLVLMNGFFVAAEFALVSARATRINQLADEEFYVPFASPQAWQTMRKAAKRLVTTYVESYSSESNVRS